MSRSTSKKKKDLKDLSLIAEDYHRPKVRMSSTTKNKKSHQGSYLIGADTGADWPLKPKWKENSNKERGALRRRWIDIILLFSPYRQNRHIRPSFQEREVRGKVRNMWASLFLLKILPLLLSVRELFLVVAIGHRENRLVHLLVWALVHFKPTR